MAKSNSDARTQWRTDQAARNRWTAVVYVNGITLTDVRRLGEQSSEKK